VTYAGPVQQISKYHSLDEVIDRCNDTRYGLAAAVMGKTYQARRDQDCALPGLTRQRPPPPPPSPISPVQDILTVAHAVRAGTVWVNCYDALEACMPFGGYKESGTGRELGKGCRTTVW
jgi:acyl-CoA reductase-like NAD-dependent aldehyde dehydrogenase